MSGRVAGTALAGSPDRSHVMGHFTVDTRVPTDLGPTRGYVRIDAGR